MISTGTSRAMHLQNNLQDDFTAKCDFLILRVRFILGFYLVYYQLTRAPYNYAILSEQIGWLPIRCAYLMLSVTWHINALLHIA